MAKLIQAAVLGIALTAAIVSAADSAAVETAAPAPADSVQADAAKTFTMEELAGFNGQNGKAAYIAVDGVVYDVTRAKGWKNGKHKGFSAGADVTEEINKKSPHGAKVLKKNPVVGNVAAQPAAD